MTEYLEIEDALQVVDRYRFHIRDIGLLASALAPPTTTVMGAEAYPQLAMKASALMESVARFRPLSVGSKRTAWTLMVSTLWINGCRHDFSADAGFVMCLAAEQFRGWVKEVSPRRSYSLWAGPPGECMLRPVQAPSPTT